LRRITLGNLRRMHTPRLTLSLLVTALGLSLGAAPALAAKPLATTEAATDITPVGANLHGSVDPRGIATSAYFQFGQTTKYGRKTPAQSAGLNPGAIPIAAGVSGLKSDTTYHFRIVAESKDGRTNGKDLTFKTAAPTTTIVFTPNPVTFGEPAFVSGQIVGSGASGAEVTLFGRAFPFTDPFTQIGNPVVADAAGNYLFTLSTALKTTQFQVSAKTNPPFTSAIGTLQVASKIGLSVTGKVRKGHKVRFHGIVAPAQDGIVVQIQKRKRDGSYRVLTAVSLKHRSDGRSSYSVRKKLYRRGIFRAFVNSAGGEVVAAASRNHSVRVVRR
jgi:hypothetical protein